MAYGSYGVVAAKNDNELSLVELEIKTIFSTRNCINTRDTIWNSCWKIVKIMTTVSIETFIYHDIYVN